MQNEVHKSRLSFLTLTLPNISTAESVQIAANWHEIVRVFCQRLRRFLRSRRLPGEIVGVTEVQEQRAELTGVFGLHLHMVFVGRKRRHGWAVQPKDIKKWWAAALDKYLYNPSSHYDWRAVENIQQVKKSAAGYLGKYMSKGMKSVLRLKELFPNVQFPTGWYMVTTTVRERVKQKTLRMQGELGLLLAELCESDDKELIGFRKRVTINLSDGREISVGWSGRATQEGRLIFEKLRSSIKDDRQFILSGWVTAE